MKSILAALLMFAGNAMASNCSQKVLTKFKSSNPRNHINSIEYQGSLRPGEETFYNDSEIWNAKKYSLDLYIIKSSFMAGFTHAALVRKTDCRIESLMEVYFE